MNLVPGLSKNADASVSISLQSALLGIDDHAASTTTLSSSLLQKHATAARTVSLAVPLNRRLHVLVEAAAQSIAPDAATPAQPVALAVSTSPPTSPPSSDSTTVPTPVASPAPSDTTEPGPQPPAPKKPPVTPPAVVLQSQAIVFTSTPPANATVGGAAYTVSAVADSGLPVVFSADPTSSGVCTVFGSTATPVGTGTCTIDADQPGNANYHPAPQEQQSFTVGLTSQSISFTSTPPAAATVGGASYTVAATATSSLAVSFSIAPGSASVCSISSATISFTGAGTCTVNAAQAGNASYAAAAQVQQSFTVSTPSKSSQTITFTSAAPSPAAVGGTQYYVTATASSGLTVSLSIAAGSASVCSIAGSTVSFTATGTCVVNADQGGNASYLAAPQAQQSFAVGLQTQTITFTSTAPGSAAVGGSAYTVAATASSGLTVTLSIAAGSAGVCSLSGTTVSMTGVGTCVVNADQAGNAGYAAAVQVQQSFAVGEGSQTITFTSDPGKVDKNDPPYVVSATATSGLAVTFTTDSSSNGICTVSGNTVSFQSRGTCILYANQGGNTNWLPAPQTQQVFDVKNHTPG